jgi:hypothetical protein
MSRRKPASSPIAAPAPAKKDEQVNRVTSVLSGVELPKANLRHAALEETK